MTKPYGTLVSTAGSQAIDKEAPAQWGLDSFALVEAAGRACADVFFRAFARKKRGRLSIAVLAGKGNNAADALVMLRALILNGHLRASRCAVFTIPVSGGKKPLSQAVLAVQQLGVPVTDWNAEAAAALLPSADCIIDGIVGTGLSGPLRGEALEMAETANALGRSKGGPLIVSIDIPSGNFDGWRPGMPIITAHATLAIEPRKMCLYTPAARPHAGTMLPVTGIFPPALMEKHREAELTGWEIASSRIGPVPATAYKYERGLVEIRAGSAGSTGAAKLAALGAQAAGAGLVRLIVDPALYPVTAPACSGIMVIPSDADNGERFQPSAVLLGPGWGRGADRVRVMEHYLPLEEQGLPLILDADAVIMAQNRVFHGNAIITPHPGEFAAYTGLAKDALLADPVSALRRFSAEKKVTILFKSHILYIAAPDGRIGIIDGMNPLLGAGGSGDVLAGFCAAIAARSAYGDRSRFDAYACACAAASLLVRTAESGGIAGAFVDPAELARAAAAIAGKAWLEGKA